MYIPHLPGSGFPFVEFDISQSAHAVPVLCAWPLSGQYGVGSRYLYYALVLVSIFFLKMDWMRGAATAAALIYAAVAALHAIVLSVFSHQDAVDMDIFGAFQILAIGVLSAPITVRYSRVYFQSNGRNIIFLWTLLMIAGLLSLVACFARATERPCVDASGHNVTTNHFTANMNSSDLGLCAKLQCELAFSPIRQDPQNPAQYILVPYKGMTLDTATLLCAACCIPALLSLITMWQKVVMYNRQRLYKSEEDARSGEETASPAAMSPGARENRLQEKKMDEIIKRGLNLVERIVYCVCILTIVVLGEENFWSPGTRLGVEPMSSVGQWAPIVGAVFTALGSAYTSWLSPRLRPEVQSRMLPDNVGAIALTDSSRGMSELLSPEIPPTAVLTRDRAHRRSSSTAIKEGFQHHRRLFNSKLHKVAAWTTPAPDRFVDNITETAGHERYWDYPLIPGEELRSDHWQEDVARHAERTGRSRSAQSLAIAISGTGVSSHGSQGLRPSVTRDSSGRGSNSGFLRPPTGSSSHFVARDPYPPVAASPDPESAIEDDDTIMIVPPMIVPQSSSTTSSPSPSPPIITVTSDST